MAEELIGVMKEDLPEDEISLDVYNVLLDGYCSAGNMDGALSLLEEIKKKFTPNQNTYNTLIKGYSKSNQEDKAMETMHKMNESNLIPDEVTFGHIVDVLSRKGNMEMAQSIFQQMKKELNMAPRDNTIYCSLIEGYAKCNKIKESIQVFLDMNKENIKVDTQTYNLLIHKVGRAGDLRYSFHLFDEMQKQNCPADKDTFALLIDICDHANEVKKAFEVVSILKEKKLSLSGMALGSLESLAMRTNRMDLFQAHCGNEFFITSL